MKKCYNCKKEKPREEFMRNGGERGMCNACAELQKERDLRRKYTMIDGVPHRPCGKCKDMLPLSAFAVGGSYTQNCCYCRGKMVRVKPSSAILGIMEPWEAMRFDQAYALDAIVCPFSLRWAAA